jgi:hypothetical protein
MGFTIYHGASDAFGTGSISATSGTTKTEISPSASSDGAVAAALSGGDIRVECTSESIGDLIAHIRMTFFISLITPLGQTA